MSEFHWVCQPEAEAFILEAFEKAASKNEFIAKFNERLCKETSTRLFDWLDHVILGQSSAQEERLKTLGFVEDTRVQEAFDDRVYYHPGAHLPRVLLRDVKEEVAALAFSVDDLDRFLMIQGLPAKVEGALLGKFRRCLISEENGVALLAVERRGSLTFKPTPYVPGQAEVVLLELEKWKVRSRFLEDEEASFENCEKLAKETVHKLGSGFAAWIVLECERQYWQFRNRAGQVQKMRQDRLGLGWANHDHHTFRSSRKYFSRLVNLFESLGFTCRERFYAGEEAGWGAQVMENEEAKLVLFLDVDLVKGELDIDFAHQDLPPLEKLGTIGLWCGLHGDSILHAGMHHLEAQFLFDLLKEDLSHEGVGMMAPFSSFAYLKQAFTQGEMWKVNPNRAKKLHSQGQITIEQMEHFIEAGALGSHLENLQRREGYKGFNQKNVSVIIKKTDPRAFVSD